MKNVKITSAALLLCLSLLGTSCKQQVKAPGAKSYKTLNTELSTTSVSTTYTASIRGEQFVDIRPQVAGTITEIKIAEGAKIKSGETLFVIDQAPYTAAVDAAVAAVASAEAAVATAALNAESGEALYAESVISAIELQTLKNTHLSAQAALVQCEAQLRSAENNLSYTLVKSPVDGVAGMINYRIGALVSSSSENPLVSVSNNDKMYAYFSLSESALLNMIERSGSSSSLMEQMDSVVLTLNNGSTYAHAGKVDAISGVIEPLTGSVRMRAKFDNPEGLLRDGGNGSLSIATTYQDVIVIPKVATFEIQNKTFVYRVIEGKAKSAEISIVPVDNGSEFIVTSGLNVGEEIVAEGAGLMREGTIIKGA